MSDIPSNIQGSFNQATLASRQAEAEKSRARASDSDRLREARQRFIAAQEEVEQAETLRGMRVEPDKEESAGTDARDQYESHEELDRRRREASAARAKAAQEKPPEEIPPEADCGHLIDIEA